MSKLANLSPELSGLRNSLRNEVSRRVSLFKRVVPRANASKVIRVYNAAGKVIETHDHAGDFKEC